MCNVHNVLIATFLAPYFRTTTLPHSTTFVQPPAIVCQPTLREGMTISHVPLTKKLIREAQRWLQIPFCQLSVVIVNQRDFLSPQPGSAGIRLGRLPDWWLQMMGRSFQVRKMPSSVSCDPSDQLQMKNLQFRCAGPPHNKASSPIEGGWRPTKGLEGWDALS